MAAGVAVACLVTAVIIISGGPGTHTAPATPSSAVRWTYDTGGYVNTRPAVAGGTVYVGNENGAACALDAATGRLRWAHAARSNVDAGPAVAGGTLYIGNDDGTVYALDAGP